MVDEANTRVEVNAYWRLQAETAVANFRRRKLHAEYVPDRQAACEKVLSLIPKGASIGCGDSVSVVQTGVLSILRQSGDHEMFDPFDRNEDGSQKTVGEARLELQKRAMLADVFLTGANAVTLDGKVVALDGNGNRVAAMIFGPKKIIIVAGVNKLVPDLDAALKRVHQVAAPINFRRHADKHHSDHYYGLPCVKTGTCVDCAHEQRGCNYLIVIEGGRMTSPQYPDYHMQRHQIVLVGESLGL
ncbi:MAG: lactate utilization protein [Chloroflexi bacterium]|nr:lactate utilization protein [Chloroflexota bacterium]